MAFLVGWGEEWEVGGFSLDRLLAKFWFATETKIYRAIQTWTRVPAVQKRGRKHKRHKNSSWF